MSSRSVMLSLLALGAAVQARSGGYAQTCGDTAFVHEIGASSRTPGYYLEAACIAGASYAPVTEIFLGDCIGNINNELLYLPG